jgi:hypothetical protein
MIRAKKAFLALILCTAALAAGEVYRMGAYFGPLPAKIDFDKRDGYPLHYATWAGNVYLYKQDKEINEWVGENKTRMIKEALSDAKAYAEKNGYRYFAVDNMRFQVVHTENVVELYFDSNVVVWK